MRKAKICIVIVLILSALSSCSNEERFFPDFDYTTSYFPYQYPVRTLVLGDYDFDNTRDNELKFLISANMGGVYKNNDEIIVSYKVDETLTDSLYNADTGKRILPLPKRYYTLSNNGQIIIPKGKFSGGVEVQLKDSFLLDDLAMSVNYVIPLRIISSTTDSVLSGNSEIDSPDPRIADNWVITPKNFTLFGIKFVNAYDGTYLLRGESVVKDTQQDTIVEVNNYRQVAVERDEIVTLKTISKDAVSYSNAIRRTAVKSPGKFKMEILFDSEGNAIIIDKTNSKKFNITTGTAKYIKDGDQWGGKNRNVIHLSYTITQGDLTHIVNDTLVFRNKNIVFEEFTPSIKK